MRPALTGRQLELIVFCGSFATSKFVREEPAVLGLVDVFGVPEDVVNGARKHDHGFASRFRVDNLSDEVVAPKHFVHQTPYQMHVFVADLDEDTARFREEIARSHKAITKAGQVGVDAVLPSVAKCFDLFGLAHQILDLAILHVAFAGGDLPVGTELDAVRRIKVDHLDATLEPFLLGQARHDEQAVAENQAVGPVLFVLVEIDLFGEVVVKAVEIGEQVKLRRFFGLDAGSQVVDQRLRVNLLLDVDRHGGDFERHLVELVLPLPDKLRIERWIARIEHTLGMQLVLLGKRAEFARGDVGAPLLLVLNRLDRRRLGGGFGFLAGHAWMILIIVPKPLRVRREIRAEAFGHSTGRGFPGNPNGRNGPRC